MPRKAQVTTVATEELTDDQLAALAANPKAFRVYLAKLAVASPAAPTEQVAAEGNFGKIIVDRPPTEDEETILRNGLDPDLGRDAPAWVNNAMQTTSYLAYELRRTDGTTARYSRKGGKVSGFFQNLDKRS